MNMLPVRKIGVFTSGGDCAGLNAVIRAITLRATNAYGWQVSGITHGLWGMLQEPVNVIPLTMHHVSQEILRQGGTMLGSTARDDLLNCVMPDAVPGGQHSLIRTRMDHLELDALIGIGGDGSLHIVEYLYREMGVPLIFIPKTIDNDLGMTENAIGFSTAVDIATEALDRLQPTAASHDRIMILQVMGRDAGHIALHAGIAGGADIILIPEIPYSLHSIHKKIQEIQNQGRDYALCVVAESVRTPEGIPAVRLDSKGRERYDGIGDVLGDHIQTITGIETRVTVLGHQQRGGQPNTYDRLLASALGVHAVDLIAQKQWGRMVGWRDQKVIDVPLSQAIQHTQTVDIHSSMMHTARGLGVCFGD